jgi:hypothetical protein
MEKTRDQMIAALQSIARSSGTAIGSDTEPLLSSSTQDYQTHEGDGDGNGAANPAAVEADVGEEESETKMALSNRQADGGAVKQAKKVGKKKLAVA